MCTARSQKVVPLEVLAPAYTGKTVIGDLIKGMKSGRTQEVLIYNVYDDRACYEKVGSQAISYTQKQGS